MKIRPLRRDLGDVLAKHGLKKRFEKQKQIFENDRKTPFFKYLKIIAQKT